MANLHSIVGVAFQWCNAHLTSFLASLVFSPVRPLTSEYRNPLRCADAFH